MMLLGMNDEKIYKYPSITYAGNRDTWYGIVFKSHINSSD